MIYFIHEYILIYDKYLAIIVSIIPMIM